MSIRIAREAARDLRDALAYLDDRSPSAAIKLEQRFFDLLDRLEQWDFEGPEVVLRSGTRVRSWPLPPYRVLYRRDADVLVVLRMYHQRRRPL